MTIRNLKKHREKPVLLPLYISFPLSFSTLTSMYIMHAWYTPIFWKLQASLRKSILVIFFFLEKQAINQQRKEKMHPGNHWGGSLEVSNSNADDDHDHHDRSQGMSEDWDRASLYHQQRQQQFNSDDPDDHHHHNLNDTQKSWLLGPTNDNKKKKYVDLGCVVCSRKLLKWSVWTLVIAFMAIALPIILVNTLPKHKSRPPPPDNYTLALHKALLFFNAQKCKFPFFLIDLFSGYGGFICHFLLSVCL